MKGETGSAVLAVVLAILGILLAGSAAVMALSSITSTRASQQQEAMSAAVDSRYAEYQADLRAAPASPDLSAHCAAGGSLCVSITGVADSGVYRTVTFSVADSAIPGAQPIERTRVLIAQGGSHIVGFTSAGDAVWANADTTRAVAFQQRAGECANDTRGTVWCGGQAVADIAPTVDLAGGTGFWCALDRHGVAACWGANDRGQLGDGTLTGRTTASPVAGAHVFSAIAASGDQTCGRTDGGLFCWGSGQAAPAEIGQYSLFAVRSGGGCGLAADSSAWCWGIGGAGQLGNGGTLDSPNAVQVSGGHLFASIATADGHSCGADDAGLAWCWGANDRGQLGNGGTTPSSVPAEVLGLPAVVRSAAVGGTTCAITADGQLWCWGANEHGQTGTAGADRLLPVRVQPGVQFDAFFMPPGAETCAVSGPGGQLDCWGAAPVGAAQLPSPVVSVASVGDHYCALTGAGDEYCFGGTLGGTQVAAAMPTQTVQYRQFEAYRQ